MAKTLPSKIIQICESNEADLIALCEDGSVWGFYKHGNGPCELLITSGSGKGGPHVPATQS